MEVWLQILLGVALSVGILAAIVLIGALIRLRRTLELVESGVEELLRLVADFRRSALPAIDVLTSVMRQLETDLRSLEPSLTNIHRFTAGLAAIATHLQRVEERVYRRLVPPLEEVTSIVVALLKAFSTFVRFLTNRSSKELRQEERN